MFDVMMKSSVFLAHIITNYGDKDLPVPTAVSSIPNEEELVVFILPPTGIIEPLINELLLIFFLEGVFYFCFYIWHLKAIPVFRGSIISVVGKTTVEIIELFECTQKVP